MQALLIEKKDLHCPTRWGLPATAVADLCARLHRFWQRYRDCFTTCTRDIYAAQVPASTTVRVGEAAGKYVASVPAREVRELARRAGTVWSTVELRDSERGILRVRCALMRVRVVAEGRTATDAEWLVIRQLHEPRQYSYTLLNAPADTPPEQVAEWSTRRYFVERTFQDAKSELG